MKRVIIAILLVLFVGSCSSCVKEPVVDTSASVVEIPMSVPPQRREQNRKLIDYFKKRTVLVKRDCTPKDSVVVVGTKYPNLYFDGHGTGIILNSKKDRSFIVTAAHVIYKDDSDIRWFDCEITVQMQDQAGSKNGAMKAEIILRDDKRDIALLKVKSNLLVSSSLEPAPFVGEDVWSVGFPAQMLRTKGPKLSVTKGTLATLNVKSAHSGVIYHRVTSQIYMGNSGGPVWNKTGKVVGVVLSFFSADGIKGPIPYEGYYYICPAEELVKWLKANQYYWRVFQ